MSLAMIAMLWGLSRGDRWGAQTAVFGVAAGWYLVRAASGAHPRRHRVGLAHQGVAMAAMFWMLLAISGTAPAAGMAMPGMDMTGGSQVAGAGRGITIAFAGYLAVATLWWLRTGVGLVLTGGGVAGRAAGVGGGVAGRAAGAARRGAAGLGAAGFGAVGEAACQMLMAAAMCVALIAM
jgi:Domain of unknown function (DUF5134)